MNITTPKNNSMVRRNLTLNKIVDEEFSEELDEDSLSEEEAKTIFKT